MKTYTAGDYRNALDTFAPFALAQSWDNVGLLIGSPEREVTRALVALDATGAVIDEALSEGAQLVITHHPIIFTGLKSIPAHSPVHRAIKGDIAVICTHTNLDIATGGVNDILAEMLGLRDTAPLETTGTSHYLKVVVYVPADSAEAVYTAMTQAGAGKQGEYAGAAFLSEGQGRFTPLEGANPTIGRVGQLEKVREQRLEMLVTPEDLPAVLAEVKAAHPYEEPAFDVFETRGRSERYGLGRIGRLPAPLAPRQLASLLREKLGCPPLKCVLGKGPIERVAVCGGSGGDLLERAGLVGAQALITADVKHSQMLAAGDLGMTLIDAGHYATEAVVLPTLLEKLRAALPEADVRRAESCTEPVSFV